jgi:glycerol-3-phosphate acyltransferase PlsY
MVVLILFITFVIPYLLGSFPTAYFIVKMQTGRDVREGGTGNVGAMNTMRITGKWYLMLLVFFIDLLKGILSIVLVKYGTLLGYDLDTALMLATLGVVLGHCYSLFFLLKDNRISGGKALSCFAGALLIIDPLHLLIPCLIATFIPIIVKRNFFLGQLVAIILVPFITYYFAPHYLLLMILPAIIIFTKQWPRVLPLLKGKEPNLYYKEEMR